MGSSSVSIDPLQVQQYYNQLNAMAKLAAQPRGTRKAPEYKTRATQRVAIPIDASFGGGSLEMTTGTEGDYVEFTLIPIGRQAITFKAHRKDLEAFTNELTLAKLAK